MLRRSRPSRSGRRRRSGICGGHQLIDSARRGCVTLANADPGESAPGATSNTSTGCIRLTSPRTPFRGLNERDEGVQDYTEGDILRVWQNHGLQLPRLPEGFQLLASSYLCRNQMMVKRADGQLIYTVQFHLEKSFQDLTRNLQRINPNLAPEERKRLLREEASARTLWAHQNESRDGRHPLRELPHPRARTQQGRRTNGRPGV